ncbi:Gfo/Idh/MocA family oxidoreductase [Leptospira noguchii]|uniref:Gfo/Idh/MocA family protein n=1 Tax=Leptospira noguchii TaxID=28182 RepID=UPI001F05F26A|nr:Gfo/Idh/MocA family oxidoreductase [Leptospira noguchii]MCH1912092.1 Gfo/Idh/MocA family oxidoreductase [Leptospira noguchii]MCH1915753.1 Gfo/Idh/MocA family oxidoreductase [Leptospira noguchii]UOG63208.1 Gfo/Idh/MocA family oxidoreductase [Leptospira noguchii]
MIPVLLIGLGRIASLLEKDPLRNHPCTHAGTIFSPWGRKKFFLLGAIDPSEERRNTFCKDWNIPKNKCFSDIREWSFGFGSEFQKYFSKKVVTSSNSRTKVSFRSEKSTLNSDKNPFRSFNAALDSKSRNSPNVNRETFKKEFTGKNSSSTKIDLASCLVVIATPSETHYELAKTAIDFGFRRLLVEKPVCHSLPLARKLAKLCKKTKTGLWVNHERRYHPLYIQVRKWIQEKTFGPVRTIRASVLTSARDPGRAVLDKTGPLFHDGTHAVDLLIWYLGMPDRVVSVLRSYRHSNVEEQALAFMTYPQGETVFLEAGGMRNYFQFELDIQTENARFLVGNDEVRFWKSKPSRKYKGFKSLTPVSISEKSSAGSNPFLNLYDSIFRHLSGKPSSITGDIEENLQILTLLDTIRRKAEKRILEV